MAVRVPPVVKSDDLGASVASIRHMRRFNVKEETP